MRNNRIQIIVLLLCCLMRFGSTAQAQDAPRWVAESIVMSNDGRHLAVHYIVDKFPGQIIAARELGRDLLSKVLIYNLDDLSSLPRRLVDLKSHSGDSALSFSPDNQQIAVADKKRLRVFNSEDHSLILDLPDTSNEKSAYSIVLSYSPDSRYIMSISYAWNTKTGEMSIWDVRTGLRTFNIITHQSHQKYEERPWLSPDWRQFVNWSHTEGVSIHQFDIEQGLGSHIATISEAADAAAFSPDSSLFALATPEGEIQIYRTDTWDLTYIQVLSEDTCGGEYSILAFGHINPWLVCYGNGRLIVWDIETGEVLLVGKPNGSFSHISMDDGMLFANRLIYTGLTDDYTITAWDADNAFEMTIYPGLVPQLHPNGELMATISPDQRVALWNIKPKGLLMILPVP